VHAIYSTELVPSVDHSNPILVDRVVLRWKLDRSPRPLLRGLLSCPVLQCSSSSKSFLSCSVLGLRDGQDHAYPMAALETLEPGEMEIKPLPTLPRLGLPPSRPSRRGIIPLSYLIYQKLRESAVPILGISDALRQLPEYSSLFVDFFGILQDLGGRFLLFAQSVVRSCQYRDC